MTVALALGFLLGAGALHAQQDGFPVLDPDAPAGTGEVVECDLGDAPEGFRCGVFRVWEDRAAGAGRTLDIHFAIVNATDPGARTDDPLLLFFGGPGGPTIGAAAGVARGFREVGRSRDLVLVDLRGIGRSGALACDVPYPGGFDSRFGTIFATDHIAACRDALARRADLTRYTTPLSVDDLEELRRWLGYEAVNLFGASYGTRVAQVYMRRHPRAVRTAVLNGVTPVSVPTYPNTSPNLQGALDRVMAECAAQPACAAAYPDLDAQVAAAFARFDTGPVAVELSDGRTVRFHRSDLGYALRGLLYGQSAEVPYRIAHAARGELTELADYYVGRTAWVSGRDIAAGNHLSVVCAEDIRRVTDQDVRRAADGTFLQGHVIRSYRDACDVWPDAPLPDGYFEPVRSDVPTLLLSGGVDPVTPPAGGDVVAERLTRHLHVVVPNAGHGVGGPCITAMVTRLIEDGHLGGVDTACVAEAPPTEFRLP